MIQFIPEPYGRDAFGAFEAFVRSLLLADWESPDGPLRLNADLKLFDLAEADFFFNARLFLAALMEDGAPTTATGNPSRAFVAQMFERLRIPQLTRQSIQRINKVTNEQDLACCISSASSRNAQSWWRAGRNAFI